MSPVCHCCPAIGFERESERVCLIPSLREEKNETGQGVGEPEFIPHPYPRTPPTHGRAESHPLTSLHPIAHLSRLPPSCVQSVAWLIMCYSSPLLITIYG